MSVVQQVSAKLNEIPLGVPFTQQEFISLGNRLSVGKVLERLAIEGKIKRVRRGVYVCPKINPHVGEVAPSIYEVLKVIAATSEEVLQVQGAEAAKLLGLSTQAPVKESYLTSGRSRKIIINNQEVELKHVSPKKLILAGTSAGIALTALWYLGKEQVTPHTIAKLKQRLIIAEFEKLLSKKKHMPAWMASAVTSYEYNNNKVVHQ